MYVMATKSIHLLSFYSLGICPYNGLILLTEKTYLGTFCNDGAFSFPVQQKIKMECDLMIIKYTLVNGMQLQFRLGFTRHDWLYESTYTNINPNSPMSIYHQLGSIYNFLYFYSTLIYGSRHVLNMHYIAYYENRITYHAIVTGSYIYVYAAINPLFHPCKIQDKQPQRVLTKFLTIIFKDGTVQEITNFGSKIVSGHNLKGFIVITTPYVAIVLKFSFVPVVANVEYHPFGIEGFVYRSENYINQETQYALYFGASISIPYPDRRVVLHFPHYLGWYRGIISIATLHDSKNVMAVTVYIDQETEHIEKLYVVSNITLEYYINTSMSLQLHIENKVPFKAQYTFTSKINMKFKCCFHSQFMAYNIDLVKCYLKTNSTYFGIPVYGICKKITRLRWMYMPFMKYDAASNKPLDFVEMNRVLYTEIVNGPVTTSPEAAKEICETQGRQLLDMFSLIVTKTELMHSLDIHRFMWWIVNVSNVDRGLFSSYCDICKGIKQALSLTYIKYSNYNKAGHGQMKYSMANIPYSIWMYNMKLFCNNSKVNDKSVMSELVNKAISFNKCLILLGYLSDLHCDSVPLLLIPCDFTLEHVGFICTRISSKPFPKKKLKQHPFAFTEYDSHRILYPYWVQSTHKCSDQTHLLNYYVCDGITDCPDGGDEANCSDICHYSLTNSDIDCFTNCHKSNCSCGPLYFQCESGGCIPSSKICDNYVDCTDKSDEKDVLCPLAITDVFAQPEEYIFKKYEIDFRMAGTVALCLKENHGVLFTDQICDGIMDCMTGIDEYIFDCDTLTVLDGLRCPRDGKLIFIWEILYGKQSPLVCSNYDIYHIHHANIFLPYFCHAKGLAVACISPPYLPILKPLTRSLIILEMHSVDNITIEITQSISFKLFERTYPFSHKNITQDMGHNYLLVLKFIHSNISVLYSYQFSNLYYLTMLVLHNNSLAQIQPLTFYGLSHLAHLDLSLNPIHSISDMLFINVVKLKYLDLSHTNIAQLCTHMFKLNSQLKTLILHNTHLVRFTFDMLHGLHSLEVLDISKLSTTVQSFPDVYMFRAFSNLSLILVVNFEICCMVAEVDCVSDLKSRDVFYSCENIIHNNVLIILTYVYAALSAALNVASLIWHLNSTKLVQLLLLCNLNVADGLMAVYLFIIITVHHIYGGDVAYVAMFWKRTILCKLTGTIMLISVMASNVSTLLLAIDRFICFVWKPFQRHGFTTIQVVIALVASYIVVLVPPILASLLSHQPVENSVCIPVGSSVSAPFSITYACINTLLFILIAIAYSSVILKIKKSSEMSKSNDKSQKVMLRLGALVCTNFIVSMTVTILSIVSLFPTRLPASIEANVAFLLFPINSSINPIINTITTNEFITRINIHSIPMISKQRILSWVKKVVSKFVKV